MRCPGGNLIAVISALREAWAIQGKAGAHHLLAHVHFSDHATHNYAATGCSRLHALAADLGPGDQLVKLAAGKVAARPRLTLSIRAALAWLKGVDPIQPNVLTSYQQIITVLGGGTTAKLVALSKGGKAHHEDRG